MICLRNRWVKTSVKIDVKSTDKNKSHSVMQNKYTNENRVPTAISISWTKQPSKKLDTCITKSSLEVIFELLVFVHMALS